MDSQIVGAPLISEFEVHYHSTGELLISRPLDQEYDAINFAFYLDYIVCCLGKDVGATLAKRVYALADFVYNSVVATGCLPHELPANLKGNKDLAETVHSTDGLPVSAVLRLLQRDDGHIVSAISVEPETILSAPGLFVKGLEALFFEILEQGSQQAQHLLAVLLLVQCSWYLDKGIPTLDELGGAPDAAMEFVGELTSSQEAAIEA
ncbi:hypothetical protein OAO01_07655 [Oligoflexia bacterium]|nr:hypothetical protein [Oligoflexia bacterium]